jgi:hypothetical protein
VIFPFQELVVDFVIVVGSYLNMENLVELQREKTSVGENTFLINRKC